MGCLDGRSTLFIKEKLRLLPVFRPGCLFQPEECCVDFISVIDRIIGRTVLDLLNLSTNGAHMKPV